MLTIGHLGAKPFPMGEVDLNKAHSKAKKLQMTKHEHWHMKQPELVTPECPYSWSTSEPVLTRHPERITEAVCNEKCDKACVPLVYYIQVRIKKTEDRDGYYIYKRINVAFVLPQK